MATVINTPGNTTDSSAGAGWAVALVILVALIVVGLFVYPGLVRRNAAPATVPGTNINVSLPGGASGSGATTPSTGGGATPAPAR